MKNIQLQLVLILLFSIIPSINAQMPVTDAAAGAQLSAINRSNLKAEGTRSSTLAKAAAQLQQLQAMKEQYDKQIEMVETISDYVKKSKQVINMKNCLSDITSQYSKGINYVYNEKEITIKDRAVFSKVYAKMIAQSLEDFEYGYKIIGDGTLKMNDAERLNILTEVENKMKKNRNMITYMNNSVRNAVSQKIRKKKEDDYVRKNRNSINGIIE